MKNLILYIEVLKDSNIKAGQDILVQVNKEEVGTKGAKLNTEIYLIIIKKRWLKPPFFT